MRFFFRAIYSGAWALLPAVLGVLQAVAGAWLPMVEYAIITGFFLAITLVSRRLASMPPRAVLRDLLAAIPDYDVRAVLVNREAGWTFIVAPPLRTRRQVARLPVDSMNEAEDELDEGAEVSTVQCDVFVIIGRALIRRLMLPLTARRDDIGLVDAEYVPVAASRRDALARFWWHVRTGTWRVPVDEVRALREQIAGADVVEIGDQEEP